MFYVLMISSSEAFMQAKEITGNMSDRNMIAVAL